MIGELELKKILHVISLVALLFGGNRGKRKVYGWTELYWSGEKVDVRLFIM